MVSTRGVEEKEGRRKGTRMSEIRTERVGFGVRCCEEYGTGCRSVEMRCECALPLPKNFARVSPNFENWRGEPPETVKAGGCGEKNLELVGDGGSWSPVP